MRDLLAIRDNTFFQFPTEIHRRTDGLELLGSPVHGSDSFFQNMVTKQIDKVLDIQSHLNDIDNPQVELHLLCSCLSVCNVNHLLRTVMPGLTDSEVLVLTGV